MEELKIKKLEEEIQTLKEIQLHNAKKFIKLGRPYKLDEPLTERMSFVLTKSQSIKLKKILTTANVDLSTFIRGLIFGDE